jgi:hypothetical protein
VVAAITGGNAVIDRQRDRPTSRGQA